MTTPTRPSRPPARLATPAAALALMAVTAGAAAQSPSDQLPPELQGVGIEERLGAVLPLDLEFTDETGRVVRLGDYLSGDRPVILTPVFYECPMLCTLVLNGMVAGLNDLEWTAGDEFDIVTFSFDHTEAHQLAEVKKRAYLTQYRRDGAKDGWHFLVGSEASVRTLTETIGFRFNPLDDGTIAHSASIMFITPDGRISRYMNDVAFKTRDLRLALVEASEGTIGSPMDRFLLFNCFVYDPDSNSFVPSAWKLMRGGGLLTVLGLALGIAWLWRRGPRDPRADVEVEHLRGGSLSGSQS